MVRKYPAVAFFFLQKSVGLAVHLDRCRRVGKYIMNNTEEKMTVFQNDDFGEIRTFLIKDTPWFVGKDVAMALGYSDANKAIAMHVDDDDKLNDKTASSLGQRGGWLINESGLYSLVMSSKLPAARKFKKWVTSEVLPSIRKNGGYLAGQEELSPQELMAKAILVAQKTLEDREKRIAALSKENEKLEAKNAEMAPKAAYFDDLVETNLLTNIRDTAKELGISQKVFVEFLMTRRYLYRDSHGQLRPYAIVNKGLFKLKEYTSGRWSGVQTLITPKGRETFRLLCTGIRDQR